MLEDFFPITATGFAAIVAASVVIMQTGLRKSILNPYLFVCLSYFRFFGFPLDDPEYAFAVDLAHLLAFSCFSIAFFQAMGGPGQKTKRFLRHIWPPVGEAGDRVPALSRHTAMLLALVALGYAAFDLWLNSLVYGGIDGALVRFYVSSPDNDVSPWLTRLSIWLSRVSVLIVFVLRLNYRLYGRGRLATALALFASLFVAFPTGSAGKFILPVLVCVIADILAALHQHRRLRPGLDVVALCAFAVCGGMFLHVIRATTFQDVSQVVDEATDEYRAMPDKFVFVANRAHSSVSANAAFCLKTFGSREDFLPGHTLYTMLVNPIPREWWPGKPVSFGRLLVQIKRGTYGTSRGTARGISMAAGLAGEGYANAGYPGIFVLSLCIGYVCGKAAKLARVCFCMPSYPILILGLGAYRFSSACVRGQVHSACLSTLYPLVGLAVVFVVWAKLGAVLRTAAGSSICVSEFRLKRQV